ncbi:MAG: hypothetical protein ACE37B_00005 [Ilumatobacter sp.]|uniref:hypothetical protein n=1 Tax=Ilumatobacter sp. TaxID=1967498 RepID=UPI00391D3639
MNRSATALVWAAALVWEPASVRAARRCAEASTLGAFDDARSCLVTSSVVDEPSIIVRCTLGRARRSAALASTRAPALPGGRMPLGWLGSAEVAVLLAGDTVRDVIGSAVAATGRAPVALVRSSARARSPGPAATGEVRARPGPGRPTRTESPAGSSVLGDLLDPLPEGFADESQASPDAAPEADPFAADVEATGASTHRRSRCIAADGRTTDVVGFASISARTVGADSCGADPADADRAGAGAAV